MADTPARQTYTLPARAVRPGMTVQVADGDQRTVTLARLVDDGAKVRISFLTFNPIECAPEDKLDIVLRPVVHRQDPLETARFDQVAAEYRQLLDDIRVGFEAVKAGSGDLAAFNWLHYYLGSLPALTSRERLAYLLEFTIDQYSKQRARTDDALLMCEQVSGERNGVLRLLAEQGQTLEFLRQQLDAQANLTHRLEQLADRMSAGETLGDSYNEAMHTAAGDIREVLRTASNRAQAEPVQGQDITGPDQAAYERLQGGSETES